MKIERVRLSEQVANEIQAMILNNDYKTGERLPIENELANMFSVSRITVREAVSKLSLVGIIDVRQGEGTFVKELTPESFMKPLLPMLRMDKKSIQDVFEVRLLIECKTAELAAKNANAKQLAKIKKHLDAMDNCMTQGDLVQYNEYDVRFHYEVAKSCGNHVLSTIQGLLMDMVKEAVRVSIQGPDALARSKAFHNKIYEALQNQDGELASKMMKIHLEGGAYYVNTNL